MLVQDKRDLRLYLLISLLSLVLSILVAYLRHQEEGLHRKVVQSYLSSKKGQCQCFDIVLHK